MAERFLRKSHVLKMACVAQVVNVLGPILTRGNEMLKQSIYYPIALFSQIASGAALDLHVQSPYHTTARYGEMPLLDVSATYDAEHQTGALFVFNRSLHETVETELIWQDGAPSSSTNLYQMAGSDPKAANTWEQPNNLIPHKLKNFPR